jgi:ParB/RepB/Spo0J family partition protein
MTAAKKAIAVEVREIAVGQLVLSQDETRKTIDQIALKELSESIIAHGVQEPLLVRPLRAMCVELEDGSEIDCPPMSREKCSEFLLREDVVRSEVDDTYSEIVSGQRRWLAAKLAGYRAVPCIVREMSDADAAEARITANLQREDLPPVEEAEAYGKLLAMPGATVESVAAALAKSPSYVGRRLKLLDAVEPVREALKFGAIEIGHALELARLSERQQRELLDWLNVGYRVPDEGDKEDEDVDDFDDDDLCKYCQSDEGDLEETGRTWSNEKRTVCSAPECVAQAQAEAAMGGWKHARISVAELRTRIARNELRILGDAPFPLEDAIPPMACTACPKRSSNAQGLFDDILRDTCTDPECYEAKLRVWVKSELYKADQAGKGLVMLYDGHAQDKAGVSKWNAAIGVCCASQEDAIWVSGRLIGRHVNICRDKKCAEHRTDSGAASTPNRARSAPAPKQSAEEKAKAEAQQAERQKLQQKVATEKAYRERLWKAITEASISAAAEQYIIRQACAETAINGGGLVARALGMPDNSFEYGKREDAVTKVAGFAYKSVLRGAALALVVDDVAVGEFQVSRGEKPEGLERMAKLLGVDVALVRSGKPAPAAKPAKKTAAPAAKKKAAKPVTKKKTAKKGGRK